MVCGGHGLVENRIEKDTYAHWESWSGHVTIREDGYQDKKCYEQQGDYFK